MSSTEEQIVKRLHERFDGLTIDIQRERRIWLEAPRPIFLELLAYLYDEMGFTTLGTITGLDSGEMFQLIYHLTHTNGIVMNARVSAPADNPVFDTATDIFKGATFYELEARNLLGLTILGLPEDNIYPLPDNWPKGEYPLRKSWEVPSRDGQGSDKAAERAAKIQARKAAREKARAAAADQGEESAEARAEETAVAQIENTGEDRATTEGSNNG